MKKSFLALLAIATLAVTAMSSCSKDSDSNTPTPTPDPDPTPVTTDTQVAIQCAASNDILDLFDIQAVRTLGTSTQTYSFNNAGVMFGSVAVKFTTVDQFTLAKSATATVTTTVTPKANWQEVVKAKGNNKLHFVYYTAYSKTDTNPSAVCADIAIEPSEVTQELMNDYAAAIKKFMDKTIE